MITYKEFKELKKGDPIFVEGNFGTVVKTYTVEEDLYDKDMITYSVNKSSYNWNLISDRTENNIYLASDKEGINEYFNSKVKELTDEMNKIATEKIPEVENQREFYLKYNSNEEVLSEKVKGIATAASYGDDDALINLIKEVQEFSSNN